MAIATARAPGQYKSLTKRDSLGCVQAMAEFKRSVVAGISKSADSGRRGLAKWRNTQTDTGDFAVSAASRTTGLDEIRRPLLLDIKEACEQGWVSPLEARTGAIVAVLEAFKRHETSSDGELAAKKPRDS